MGGGQALPDYWGGGNTIDWCSEKSYSGSPLFFMNAIVPLVFKTKNSVVLPSN